MVLSNLCYIETYTGLLEIVAPQEVCFSKSYRLLNNFMT